METTAFKFNEYWIWAIDYETALNHYNHLVRIYRLNEA